MAISPATERDHGASASRPERRRHARARFSVRRPVSISLDRKATAVVLDLSEAGVGIRSLGPVRRGSKCRLHFQLPDTHERIEAEAVASWSDNSCRAGFEFTAMAAATRGLLSEWVERRTYSGPSPFSRPTGSHSGKGTEIIALERQLATLGQEDALRLIVSRCQSLTEAEGVAIALAGRQGFVCRATLGSAPDLGVTINPNSGLSGECLRTGVVVRCENTELDPRVDRDVCRALNLRSAVIVPVVGEGYNVAGLIEVFSSRPHAFSGRHVLLLRQIAELISGVLSKSGKQPPTAPKAAPVKSEPETAATVAVPTAVKPAAPPTGPAAGSGSAGDMTSRVTCDVCGFENLPIDRDCQNCDVPLPGALDDPDTFTVEAPPQPEVREVVRPLRTPEPSAHSLSGLLMWFLLGVVLAVSVVAGVRWWYNRPPATQSSIELSPLLNAAVEASEKQQPMSGLSGATTAAPIAKPKPSPMQSREVVLTDAKLPQTPRPAAAASVPVPSPEPLSGLATAKLDAPIVEVLSAPAATPRWVIASSSAVPAKLLHKVEPAYPPAALARRIEGTVLLRAIISHKGAVQSVTLLQGQELLAQAAVHAVKQWRYSPAQLDGQAVDADANITISFSLAH